MIYIAFILINFAFGDFLLNLIYDGFDKPVFATSNKAYPECIYIVEQDGIIKVLDENNNVSTFIDLKDKVHDILFPADEMGLLGLAFDPNFANNGLFYINYNDNNDNTIISRFSSKKNIGELESEKILLTIEQPYSNHNGGSIEFGPDNYLYISVGDGGSSGDPQNRAQDLTNYFGSILRIEIPENADYYLIPKDNPFYGIDEYRQEIWSYGLRNAWKFTFDRFTGDIYIGDVGQNSWEEINFIKSGSNGGLNFGWNIMEASSCYKPDFGCDNFKSQLPIFEYPNDAKYIRTILGLKHKNVHGCSVTGGYVYRGENIKELYGKYIFGDYCTGKIWSFKYDNGELLNFEDHTNELLQSINKKKFYLSSFGETSAGELLLIDYSGSLYKLVNK